MKRPTDHARAGLRPLAAILLLLAFLAAAHAAPAPALGPNQCTAPADESLPASIDAATMLDCVDIEVDGDVTVGTSGTLTLSNATLTFTDGHDLTILSGGTLALDNVTLRAKTPDDPSHAWRLNVTAGASASFDRVHAIDAYGIRIAAAGVQASDLTVERSHAYAIRLDGGQMSFTRLLVEDAPTAIVMRSASNAFAREVLLRDVGLLGVDAAFSELTLQNVFFDDVAKPFRVAGDATVLARHVGTFGTPGAAQLTGADDDAPVLEVLAADPAWDASESVLDIDGAVLRLGWLPAVRVLEDVAGQPAYGAGVNVEVRRTPDAAPLGQATTNSAGVTPAFRVIEVEATKDQTTVHPDPYVFLRDQHNVNSTQVPLHAATLWDVLLPNVPDNEPPYWDLEADEDPLTADPWTHDGIARLSWMAATDGPDEDRRVNYYEVIRYPTDGSASVVANVFGTQYDAVLDEDGPVGFQVRPVDVALNSNQAGSNLVSVRLDPEPPTVDVDVTGTQGPNATWFRSDSVSLVTTADDVGSGLASFEVRLPGQTAYADTSEDPYEATAEGLHPFTFRARDASGHETVLPFPVGLDRVPPDVDDRFDPLQADGESGWYATPPVLHVDASDATSGVHSMQYRLGTGNWTPFDKNTTIRTPGNHILTLNVTDQAGNSRLLQRALRIDSEKPTLDVEWDGTRGSNEWWKGPVTARVTADDEGSGIRELGYRTPAETWTQTEDDVMFEHARNTTVAFHAVDHAGNEETTTFLPLKIDREAPIAPVVEVRPPSGPGASYQLDWSLQPAVDAMSGIASLEVHRSLDGGPAERVVTAPGAAAGVAVPITPIQTNEFFVRAIDHAGWTADSNKVRITSSVAVGTSLDLPQDPIWIRGQHTFTAEPPDPANVTSVSFYVDGVLAKALTSPPFSHTVDADGLPDGVHSLGLVVAHADGTTREETYPFEVRNGYTAIIAEHAVWVAGLSVVGLIGGALGFVALRRLRDLEAIA